MSLSFAAIKAEIGVFTETMKYYRIKAQGISLHEYTGVIFTSFMNKNDVRIIKFLKLDFIWLIMIS